MSGESSSTGLPFGIRATELVVATALAVGAAFAVEYVPDSTRFSIAVGFLALIALYLLVALRRIYRIVVETNQATRLLSYRSDPDTGILKKGEVRNVALRVQTIILLLDKIVAALPEERRRQVLLDAGREAGRTWGEEYARLCRTDLKIGDEPLEVKTLQWAIYDATAGMGRLKFNLSEKGAGSVTLKNGFLSDIDTNCVLDFFFSGYLEGTLEHLVGRTVLVELQEPSSRAHVETEFDVDIPQTAR